jgi:hypothetical protein
VTFTGVTHDSFPEYWRDLYGDATITWVPPVTNYNYPENLPIRGLSDNQFRWEEVSINLDNVQSGAIIDFIMPDQYVVQVTPDIGWSNTLAMFGEDEELLLNNPHLTTIDKLTIVGGTLTDNGDGSVTASLSVDEMESITIPDYTRYLWRAVPWGDGNPGLGGLPQPFEYVSAKGQLNFQVDDIIKETRRATQTISGTKSPRVKIEIQEENSPTIFVEVQETTWRVTFTIDRPNVKFKIKAIDQSNSVETFFQVDIDYESFGQFDGHIWNSFDGFGLLASMDRLPGETSTSLRERIKDTFANRGSSDYIGLISGVNRELGLNRLDQAITLTRALNTQGIPIEKRVEIESTHTRVGIRVNSFIINDEIKKIDPYFNKIVTDKRIYEIDTITNEQGVEVRSRLFHITDEPEGNEIKFDESVRGIVKVTYTYIEDIEFSDNPLLGDLCAALNSVTNPSGRPIIVADLSPKLSGSELSKYTYHRDRVLTDQLTTVYLGWSMVGIFSISNAEWKRSFRDSVSLYFNSDFYKYVLELKSQTNIEWGFVVADQDFWDAVDSDLYGRDSLELAFDIRIANYSVPAKLPRATGGRTFFDPWEAFRMGYYFDDNLIKNKGFPKVSFRSGVGFKKDCVVGLETISLGAPEDKINQNPIVSLPENVVDLDNEDISNFIISF